MPRGPNTPIPESVVQDIWARQMFDNRCLISTDGKSVRVVNTGIRNDGGGPDFLQAQIFIGDLRWFGDVEIHVTSGAWFQHGHQDDPRYNNVVLHVVLGPDMWTGTVRREDGTLITEIVLDPYITQPVSKIVTKIARQGPSGLLCGDCIRDVPHELSDRWVRALARRRLLRKMSGNVAANKLPGDRFLRLIFRALGYARNSDAMETLFDIAWPGCAGTRTAQEAEAWFLGVAGLLEGTKGISNISGAGQAYAFDLLTNFVKLQQLLQAGRMMQSSEWQFAPLRPANAPVVRVAQAARYAFKTIREPQWSSYSTFSRLIRRDDALTILRKMLTIEIPTYYRPGTSRSGDSLWSCPGRSTIDRIIVNAAAPHMMWQADRRGDEHIVLAMLGLLSQIGPEENAITRTYEEHGLQNSHAFYSQGLHELHSFYCSRSRCLSCDIGQYMIKKQKPKNADKNSYDGL
ncbi:MAG: DUF2851 family protein [Rhodothermales bacterium]|nr:DUF2851 family protein [Rhodothermales bacterium]